MAVASGGPLGVDWRYISLLVYGEEAGVSRFLVEGGWALWLGPLVTASNMGKGVFFFSLFLELGRLCFSL